MDLATLSAAELAAAIANRQVSAVEALDHFVARCDAVNPSLNAVISFDIGGARARAAEADDATSRGESWGPLHGVPMTLKDTWEFAGMRTTAGAPELEQHRPSRHADAVQRLVDAGAVVFGKTNTPAYAGDVQTYNELFGVTNNPWDLTRTPGGSSGGAAAALAAGLTPLELGSDIGGSIRTPAHYCGVFGHKPTHGIVSLRGHIPGPPGSLATPDLAVGGPLACRAVDLRLALDVVAGPSPVEPIGWTLSLPESSVSTLAGARIGWWPDDPGLRVSRDTSNVFSGLADRLTNAGAQLVDLTSFAGHSLADIQDIYVKLLAPIVGAGLPAKVRRLLPVAATAASLQQRMGKLPSKHVASYLRAVGGSHIDWQQLDERRQHVRQRCIEQFGDLDAIVMPVTPSAALPHNTDGELPMRMIEIDGVPRAYFDQFGWIAPATLCGLPATSVPAGVAGGLPHNVQIVGAPFADRTTIHIAELIEDIDGPPARPSK